mmetsp:Transcript_6419/g.11729  ORF Transcript_6419/g.11729 Transcript_6419/m.11729 type:complete len:255 (-) Transcript_6419:91-855(-)
MLQSFLELLLLVCGIASLLLHLGLLPQFFLLLLLRAHFRLRRLCRRGLWLGFRRRWRRCSVAAAAAFGGAAGVPSWFPFLLELSCSFFPGHDVDPKHHTEYLHHSRILKVVANGRGIALNVLKHLDEVRLLEVSCCLGIARNFPPKFWALEHVPYAVAGFVRFYVLFDLLQGSRYLLVAWVDVQPFLVRRDRLLELTETIVRSTQARITFGPVGLQLNCLLRVVQSFLKSFATGLCGRSVAIQHVVLWIHVNCL